MSDSASGSSLAEPKYSYPLMYSDPHGDTTKLNLAKLREGARPITFEDEGMSMGCGPVYPEAELPDNYNAWINELKLPEHAGVSSSSKNKISVSDHFLPRIIKHVKAAVPTRCEYTEAVPTIYKVPKELKRGDEDEGYEPVAVRIGPLTNNLTNKKNSTAQLEKYKWCCVRELMKDDTAGLLKSCLESMERLDPEIKASYSEAIKPAPGLSMVLDGCFILHRLLKYARQAQGGIAQDKDWTQIYGRVWVWQLVATDLVLLENQIPFFVLRELFEQLRSRDDEPKDALIKGSLGLFRALCPYMLRNSGIYSETDYHGVRVHHLLHLFYLSVVGPSHHPQEKAQAEPSPGESDIKHSRHPQEKSQAEPSPGESDNIKHSRYQDDVLALNLPQWIPSAKELEEAGVRFRKRKESKSFLDIKFDRRTGILEIPQLQLYDFSDKLFRNLIAFEQTYPCTQCDVTTYAVFMDCLINTPEDMRILHLRGILVNQINGEQDASRFFSSICAQVRYWSDKNYLKKDINEVNDYREYRPHSWRAALVRNHCSNPWVAIPVLAAGVLLILTILQTIFTGITTFNPPK